jgi:hypothetical protein
MVKIETTVLLSTAYLGPIQYFTKLISYDQISIEYCESYLKQSYRNRTVILAANGPLQMSLPVVDGPGAKGPMRDIQLAYDHHWQQMHWRGICSAYNNSPFFEYYSDDLAPFFHKKKWKYLIDFNFEIQNAVLTAINLDIAPKYTAEFLPVGAVPESMADFRYAIHPKPQKQAKDDCFSPPSYIQVFGEKWGFVPNLSILDLLFNEGPETVSYLRSCIR